jgi:glycolate oxidase iron-sulfur subunit
LRRTKRAAFRLLLPRARLLALSATLLGLYQHRRLVGLRALVQRFLPPAMIAAERQLPRIPSPGERRRLPHESLPTGASRARVGLLEGCVAAQLLPETNRATCRVLNRHGATVVCPRGRPCCGALALHFGDPRGAMRQAISTIKAFEREKVTAVVVNSAGCGSAMKEYGRLLAGTKHAARAHAFSQRVVDISEYLVQVGIVPPRHPLDLRVAYDDPCHLLHAQRVSQPPRQLLAAIPGLKLVTHDGAETCCGAAGIYNVLQPRLSQEVLAPKIAALERAAPSVVATGNPGCVLQLRSGLERAGLAIEVVHPVELLDRAYRLDEAPAAPR